MFVFMGIVVEATVEPVVMVDVECVAYNMCHPKMGFGEHGEGDWPAGRGSIDTCVAMWWYWCSLSDEADVSSDLLPYEYWSVGATASIS